tara:strand:+ start:69 stop:716 length:648 start_codon:yes stop_codon:yes gene_type:complete
MSSIQNSLTRYHSASQNMADAKGKLNSILKSKDEGSIMATAGTIGTTAISLAKKGGVDITKPVKAVGGKISKLGGSLKGRVGADASNVEKVGVGTSDAADAAAVADVSTAAEIGGTGLEVLGGLTAAAPEIVGLGLAGYGAYEDIKGWWDEYHKGKADTTTGQAGAEGSYEKAEEGQTTASANLMGAMATGQRGMTQSLQGGSSAITPLTNGVSH